jgi:hypothetical protein
MCAVLLGYPKNGQVKIDTLGNQTVIAKEGTRQITLFGHDQPLEWLREGLALSLKLPDNVNQDEAAYALRIDVNGTLAD